VRCALAFSFLWRCTVLAGAVMHSVCGGFPGERQDVVASRLAAMIVVKRGERYWGRSRISPRRAPCLALIGSAVVSSTRSRPPRLAEMSFAAIARHR